MVELLRTGAFDQGQIILGKIADQFNIYVGDKEDEAERLES